MKKSTPLNLLILLSIGMLSFLYSCRRDKTDPVITLYGDKVMYLYLGQKYVDPGFIATDNVDGNITKRVKIRGGVDTTKESSNVIDYSVSDKKDNSVKVSRIVYVVNQSHSWTGEYIGKVVYPYPGTAPVNYFDSVIVSTTKNNIIKFKNFAGIANNEVSAEIKWKYLYGDEIALDTTTNANGKFTFPANSNITSKNCRIEDGKIYVFFTRTINNVAKDGMFELTRR